MSLSAKRGMDVNPLRLPSKDPDAVVLKYKLSSEAHERLRAVAKYTGRTISDLLTHLVVTYFPPASSVEAMSMRELMLDNEEDEDDVE